MERETIAFIRNTFTIPDEMTDEEIEASEKRVDELLNERKVVCIGNLIELDSIKKEHLGIDLGHKMLLEGLDFFFLDTCERLFIEGYYGPCVIWQRALIEYCLQIDCLSSKDVSQEIKNRINDKGKNPKIDDLKRTLMDAGLFSGEDEKALQLIVPNGDAVVHHRYDLIPGGKKIGDYPIAIASVKPTYQGIVTEGIDARKTVEVNRMNEERRMAKESFIALYGYLRRKEERLF